MTVWNKGMHLSEEYRKKISESMTGRTLSAQHKKRIAISQKKRIAQIRMCSQCSIKSKWVYRVSIPRITHYHLLLCDNCLLGYYKSGEKLEIFPHAE
jgi:hypothetical protein